MPKKCSCPEWSTPVAIVTFQSRVSDIQSSTAYLPSTIMGLCVSRLFSGLSGKKETGMSVIEDRLFLGEQVALLS